MFVKHSCGTLLWQVHNVCFFVQVLRHSHSLRLNSKHVGPKGPNAPPNIIDIWQTGRGVPSIFTQPNGKVYIYTHVCNVCTYRILWNYWNDPKFSASSPSSPSSDPHHVAKVVIQQFLSILPSIRRQRHRVDPRTPPGVGVGPRGVEWRPNFGGFFALVTTTRVLRKTPWF